MLDQRKFTGNSKNSENISSSQTINIGFNCTKTMVNLYCAEQIAIPEPFPNVLKTFAKAAIRTQPYDILRWSAGYFRCLANNLPPPEKKRLEKDCHRGVLTRGYLKVLLDQLGKGFFIERKLLHKRWMALSLPEDLLLSYLSLARMLNWPQVHWLKLVSIMVGSMNNSLHETLVMLCELITDDIEGGLARVPYWMFKICYIFLAQLECIEEQCFVNGRKVLPWGDLEPERPIEGLPRILSSTFLKDNIIAQCRRKLGKEITCECNRHKEMSSCTNFEDFEKKCSSISLPCGFEFLNGKDGQTFVIDKCVDFDSLILFLREADECPEENVCPREHMGPHYISEAQIQHAIDKEEGLLREREIQALTCKERADQFTQEERLRMLKEVGPPWTWLHNFVDSNCKKGSYNFVEEESIPSDVTPEESSDESFDFVREEPVKAALSDTNIPSEKTSSVDLNDLFVPTHEDSVTSQITCLHNLLQEAEACQKCSAKDTESVISFLQNEELGVLEKSGGIFTGSIDIDLIIKYLENAQKTGTKFETVNCISEYIQSQMKSTLKLFTKEDWEGKDNSEKSSVETVIPHEEVAEIVEAAPDIKKPLHVTTHSAPKVTSPDDSSDDDDEELDVLFEVNDKPSLTKVYENSGIQPDAQAENEHVPEEMILGLMDHKPPDSKTEVESIQSEITESGDVSGKGHQSDDSSIFETTDSEAKPKIDYRIYCGDEDIVIRQRGVEPPSFRCTIPAYPGIGPVISPQTIEYFLSYLKFRACSQRGLITPKNFNEEKCPYLVDPKPYCNPNANPNPKLSPKK